MAETLPSTTTKATAGRPTAPVIKQSDIPIKDMSDCGVAANLFSQAGFLGAKNPGEGFLALCAWRQSGMTIVDFQQQYHYRQGRFSMQAHAMLNEFVKRGGSYELVERSVERAALKLKKDGQEYISSLTWAEALAEPFIYAGNETDQLVELAKPMEKRKIKAKYQTPRSRMQMRWARVVSDGVVVLDPGARKGYTPEECDDFALEPLPRREAVEVEAEISDADLSASIKSAVPTAPPVNVKATPEAAKAVESPAPAVSAAQGAKPGQEQPKSSGGAFAVAARLKAEAEAKASQGVDYTICPAIFGGNADIEGKRWADMPREWLTNALTISSEQFPGMTQEHRAEIERIMVERDKK
jgi:hypothetical protein